MIGAVVTFLTFVAGFLVVFAINLVAADVMQNSRKRVRERLEAEFRGQQRDRARDSLLYKDLSQLAAEGFDDDMATPNRAERMRLWISQTGLNITAARLAAFMAAGACGMGAIGLLLFRHLAVGACAALIGAALPVLYMSAKRHARMEKMRAQLPDAFDLMSRILRAGQTMTQGLQAVADEFGMPLGHEFAYCYEQQNLGLSTENALRDLARRTGLLEVKIFVLAVMIHRQTGGNLSQLLGLPPAMLFLMLLINRDYTMVLFDHPILLVGMFVSMTIGAMWIKKIVSFDF